MSTILLVAVVSILVGYFAGKWSAQWTAYRHEREIWITLHQLRADEGRRNVLIRKMVREFKLDEDKIL